MNRFLTACFLAASLPLAACSSVDADYGPLSGTASLQGEVDDIEMSEGMIRFDDSGLAVYQMTATNTDSDEKWIEYRARWFDDQGIEVDDATRLWIRVNIQPGSDVALKSIAPNMKAVDCKIKIREARSTVD
jgi:uncharacterized protein YcfL